MYDLPKVMPDPEMVLALQPEELGAKLLFLMQARTKRSLGSPTGALTATTKKPKVAQGQSPYDLQNQIRRDTYTHDFKEPQDQD